MACPAQTPAPAQVLLRTAGGRSLHMSAHPSARVEVPLAQTGEGIKECELVQWFVQEGEAVAEFDQLCEVQSDKATVEITSQFAGRVARLRHSPGDMVQVGEALLELEMESEEGGDTASARTAEPASRAVPAEQSTSGGSAHAQDNGGALASPAVRRIAREYGLDLGTIAGSGPDGRVTKGDVLGFVQALATGPVPVPPAAAVPPEAPEAAAAAEAGASSAPETGASSSEQPTEPTVIPLRGYQRAMVASMTAAAAVPHFHFCDEVTMTALQRLRGRLRDDPALQGARLTYLPFILKAVSVALQEWPDVNVSLAPDGRALLRHASHNLGIAMDTPSGLVVPNIKRVQERSIVGVAADLARLQAAAAAGHLGPEDLAGGTLTVSNIGAIGGTYATPLVNVPEAAIVALGRVRRVLCLEEDEDGEEDEFGQHVPVPKMAVSWGADHRVIDGATLARFSNAWKRLLEQPERLLLHLK